MNPRKFMAPGAAFTMACIHPLIHPLRQRTSTFIKTTSKWRTLVKRWFIVNTDGKLLEAFTGARSEMVSPDHHHMMVLNGHIVFFMICCLISQGT
ncbi:uncharacterized protein B0J16DRAFT_83618 [Fusarium flagelliforme]|uniref:uncharacterized protein n=1 Tax=Fusarium flagelliforme TaxID=2675880 RepID=UPI001E8CC05B|nr:uncharacterized protein B0J16DRAFT_83618 [Fusarium flagelliforme]KAH7193658.1 hypothetical protein B0J16DRAFT_83618 [Fusarium flagelliforme]